MFKTTPLLGKAGSAWTCPHAASLCALLAALLLAPANASAQNTVNASGGTGTIGGDTYAYSIGEMAVVGTASNGNLTVTQGVLQAGADIGTAVQESSPAGDRLALYPNPVADQLFLQPAAQGGTLLHFRLLDAAGRLLLQREVPLATGNERQRIDMEDLAGGTYFLKADLLHGTEHHAQTFKVIKGAGRP